MNWGKSIILAFILFAIFIGVLVTVCVKHDVNLVSKEYYKEELEFQKQMEREQNAELLAVKPLIEITDTHELKIASLNFNQLENGKLILYSPTDVKQDRVFELLKADHNNQVFSLDNFKAGKYVVKMNWTVAGKEYYVEKMIII